MEIKKKDFQKLLCLLNCAELHIISGEPDAFDKVCLKLAKKIKIDMAKENISK